METLSKKTTGAAPTSGNLEDRLLEARGKALRWSIEARLAEKQVERWKARHADLCKASMSIAVGSMLLGVVIGYLFSAWVR